MQQNGGAQNRFKLVAPDFPSAITIPLLGSLRLKALIKRQRGDIEESLELFQAATQLKRLVYFGAVDVEKQWVMESKLRKDLHNQLEEMVGNLRVYCHDAVEVLQQNISHHSLERVNIYFPDPWHKTKHHKRRLIQPEFLTLLHSRLKNKGLLHIATDWEPYAKHVITVVNQHAGFNNIAGSKIYTDPAELGRPETKFERRGVKLGHGVWDMAFKTCHNTEER